MHNEFTSSETFVFVFAYLNSNSFYSVHLFCTRCCFAIDICFWLFCSKDTITFKNAYLVSCWFQCVDTVYIKFRFCQIFRTID